MSELVRISHNEYRSLFRRKYRPEALALLDPGRVIEVHASGGPADMCGHEPNAPVVLVAYDAQEADAWAATREYDDQPTYWLPQEELEPPPPPRLVVKVVRVSLPMPGSYRGSKWVYRVVECLPSQRGHLNERGVKMLWESQPCTYEGGPKDLAQEAEAERVAKAAAGTACEACGQYPCLCSGTVC